MLMNFFKAFSKFTGTTILFSLIYTLYAINFVLAEEAISQANSHQPMLIKGKSAPELNRSLYKLEQQEFRRSKVILLTDRINSDVFRGARPKYITLNIFKRELKAVSNTSIQAFHPEQSMTDLNSIGNISRKVCNNNIYNIKIIAYANNLKTRIIIA